MEPTKTQEERVTTAAEVVIGFEEAIVVCVEYGDQDSGILLEMVT